MTQDQEADEASLIFLGTLAFTITQIEKAQPEPGFRQVFMDLPASNLKSTVDAVDPAIDQYTLESVRSIEKVLSDLLIAGDYTDAIERGNATE